LTLTDAGPLVALIDRGEPDHARCVAALSGLSAPLVTTWPALTEAMYLLGAAAGFPGQESLWTLLERGDLQTVDIDQAMRRRSRALMEKYRDRPMDLADATLVTLAEAKDLDRIFTLDGDFHIYRIHGRRSFEVIP
jgi:predicted nucleic acid-binding protein